ncbi:MAG: hypothetical protein ACSHXL_03370, partial [Bacteroidota bacterium]
MKDCLVSFFRWIPVLMVSCLVLCADESTRPGNLTDDYRYIGEYQTYAETRVENAQAMSSLLSPIIFRVYSDGVDVRVYCVGLDDESFTTYQIYQSNGIGVSHSPGEIDYIAGVQASCTQGEM